jgi:hypothetical protein
MSLPRMMVQDLLVEHGFVAMNMATIFRSWGSFRVDDWAQEELAW